MKKTTTLMMLAVLLVLSAGCTNDEAIEQSNAKNDAKEILKSQAAANAASETDDSRAQANNVINSIANTTWDFTVYNGTILWHADVIFYRNGTTMYDEPESPGAYTSYGTWHQVGNVIYYDLSNDVLDTSYYFTGTIVGNTMSGTYTWSTAQNWTAVKY